MTIDTDAYSSKLRDRVVDNTSRRFLVTDFRGTDQEKDLSTPPNCRGLGRIRHFTRAATQDWPENPLPIDPALKALNLPRQDTLEAQVFQLGACNWRCWYCFVPFALLNASDKYGSWVTAEDLVRLLLSEATMPPMIDLTGGQPDIVPEWVPWMIRALRSYGEEKKFYLWSDDNLSNDYFWRYLSDQDREEVATYPLYGRVCCFKGFDPSSFAFNTAADPDLFDRQFQLFNRLLTTGIDLYAYVTLTYRQVDDLVGSMMHFVDRLQLLDESLPLRTIPLEIVPYGVMASRLSDDTRGALSNQYRALEVWRTELESRFSSTDRCRPVSEILLGQR